MRLSNPALSNSGVPGVSGGLGGTVRPSASIGGTSGAAPRDGGVSIGWYWSITSEGWITSGAASGCPGGLANASQSGASYWRGVSGAAGVSCVGAGGVESPHMSSSILSGLGI